MDERRTVLILQARMGSTRLPGKVLRPIIDTPMLELQLARLQRARSVDAIVVATTVDASDDPVAALAERTGAVCFRGSDTDVLDRYAGAARVSRAGVVVRVTGDCPLHDPEVVDLVIERFRASGADYAAGPSNYPEGVDTEVFTVEALEESHRDARLPSEREHVTQYIRNHPALFTLDRPWTRGQLDHSSYHWSVDSEQDFRFVEMVYSHLQRGDRVFGMGDVLVLLEAHPELLELNSGATGREGLERSKQEDAAFLTGR